ncbi:hypothetical protein [Nocardia tengchongensis]|uniref:hypothetical protein n=1 Tax=Nocardia tengchongensis TaxID=2055889 RepID=UPI00360E1F0C
MTTVITSAATVRRTTNPHGSWVNQLTKVSCRRRNRVTVRTMAARSGRPGTSKEIMHSREAAHTRIEIAQGGPQDLLLLIRGRGRMG